jgi:hypothetical protein
MAMKQSTVRHAQETLGRRLREVFGEELKGILGFGAGLDRSTREMKLNVAVDDAWSARQAETCLPKNIDGLQVNIEQRARARGR